MIALIEELIRTASFATRFDIKDILVKRIEYIFNTICEHEQKKLRNTENEIVLNGGRDQHGAELQNDGVVNA